MADRTPADDGFFMPAEWAPHERCWMAWPCRDSLWGEGLAAARAAHAAVAKAISGFEPVTMLANAEELEEAQAQCGPGVTCQAMPLDDSWMRDSGPSFVIDGKGGIAGVDWRFNAWGGKFQPYDQDALTAERLLAQLEVSRYAAPLVLEGGSIHVDGEGTLLTSEECLLNPNRNPDLGRADIEDLLRRYAGVERFVWLGEGLDKDDTDGHVDNIACFVRPSVVMAVTCDDPADRNHAILKDNLARLAKAKDARGRALEVIELPLPREPRYVDGQRLALSYVNYYIANGGVVMPRFGDANDAPAFEIVSRAFPERKVVQVEASAILVGGGGIHCITQQQPRP
ncbi:agmatine deiminase family protein [Pelagibius marinus]|uniref:agmatine deiminase family protein n=1 Tax=Pelagibius marinus TaxID=2762760 RepID=UPI001872E736|nr:agmatine deiminase family protein [Pelagibius marinus]